MPPVQKEYSNLYLPGAIVLAGIIVAVGLYAGLSAGSGGGGGDQNQVAVDVRKVDIKNHPYLGEENAPVVVVEWSDYQCPFCKAVEIGHSQIPTEPAIPKIISEYVDTGKVKIVFKDYAFLGPDSQTAALYGRAIWDLYPTKYWVWREAMYKAQDDENGGFGDEASIVTLIRKISGIDADAVKARVASKNSEYQAAIDADKAEGTSFGIQGTPGFITGKTLLPGAVAFDQFKTAIDQQL
ncbi:thioredoxin domain-containing protein [Candidatus Kaiserbacteria bacterium]|nr:thioredoxin domain-containing protein [Candidatus Kaiserbacteria bacterium]